jgi:hypothetical protein
MSDGLFIDEDEALFLDSADPGVGNIKIVGSTAVEINDCDAITNWSIAGGASSFALSTGSGVEGTGCLIITVPASTTATLTWNAGPINLGGCGWCRFYIYMKSESTFGTHYSTHNHIHAHMGESDSYGIDLAQWDMTPADSWVLKNWDLTGVAVASKDAITYWQIEIANQSSTKASKIYLDYVFGDPGSGIIKADDGGGVRQLFPKVYVSSYVGTGGAQTISIPRAGTPCLILVICESATAEYPTVWMKGMTDNTPPASSVILKDDGGGGLSWNGGVHNITIQAFDLDASYEDGSNTLNVTYYYIAIYED